MTTTPETRALPPPGLIDRMCLTYRHDFGLMSEQEREGTRTIMRQLYEHDIAPHIAMLVAAPAAPAPEPVAYRWRMAKSWAWHYSEDFPLANDGIEIQPVYAAPPAPVAASAVDALRPFAAAVHNDNGDVTISTGHLRKGDYIRAHHAVSTMAAAPDPAESLCAAARAEAAKAMRKFPQPNYVISKVAEEAGEVVKAAIHCAEGREQPEAVVAEIRQAMAMLIRLYVEGDQVHGLPPLAATPSSPNPVADNPAGDPVVNAPTWLHDAVDAAAIDIAASGKRQPDGSALPPRLRRALIDKLCARYLAATGLDLLACLEPGQATHRHVKRGTLYRLLGIGKMQAEDWRELVARGHQNNRTSHDLVPVDMREVAIYIGIDDGLMWVRPREEFEDGRFDALPPPPAAEGQS